MPISTMSNDDASEKVRAFKPTGNEPVDLQTLDDLLDQLGDLQRDPDVRRELISIFERCPGADLGSPGPIVHSLEKAPIDDHVQLLADSLRRRATIMTIWMAERCFRSKLSDRNRSMLLEALADAGKRASPGEVAEAIADAIREYGA
jgi:hypothetical protein